MLQYTLQRLRRTPLQALGVFLFAAILSAALCYLRGANETEVERYHETYQKIPVTVSITDLSGTINDGLGITNEFVLAFSADNRLGDYLSNIQMLARHTVSLDVSGTENGPTNLLYMLIGVQSTKLTPELWPESDCVITWNEGYDESALASQEMVCLVPEGMHTRTDPNTGEEYIRLEVKRQSPTEDKMITTRVWLTVAGTYTGSDNVNIYSSFYACQQVYRTLEKPMLVDMAQATLADNDTLATFREASKQWFAEPNVLGQETPWGKGIYDYYPFALNINDYLLKQAATTMETSIAINRLCAVLVLCLSAGAGFLIGFLTVRSRKREIALMRTLGKSNGRIYLDFALEQMLCVALGVAVGGAYGLWDPADQLGILAGVYFVGLTFALMIFLHTNLLSSIMEVE